MIIILFPFSFVVVPIIILQDTYFLFYDVGDLKIRCMIYIPIIYIRTWYIIRYVTKEENPKRQKIVRHKTRNSETENLSWRTTVIMRHKSFVPQFFCRLDNGLPGFTVKPVVGDYDIEYSVLALTWSRWYVMSFLERRLSAISNVDRFNRQQSVGWYEGYIVTNVYSSQIVSN